MGVRDLLGVLLLPACITLLAVFIVADKVIEK